MQDLAVLLGRRKGNIFSHSVRHKKIILPRKGPVFFTYFNANVMRCSVAATGERKGNVGRWVAALVNNSVNSVSKQKDALFTVYGLCLLLES